MGSPLRQTKRWTGLGQRFQNWAAAMWESGPARLGLLCNIKSSGLAKSSQTVRNIQLGQVLVVAVDEFVPVRRHDHAKHLPSGENASAGGSRCRHDPIRAMLPRCQLQGRRVARQAHV